MAGRRLTDPRLLLALICTFVVGVGFWNVATYSPQAGYDALSNISYADGLVPGGNLPHRSATQATEYYTPPGFYAVAGSADWVAAKLGAADPYRAGVALDVLYLLGTVLLVAQIARELWPGRERIALGAAAFVALLPVAVQLEAMFHPETMSLFLSTLALWLCVRTFTDPRYAWTLGAVLGAAQLVRAFALWTVAAAAIALLAGRRFRALAIVIVVAALIPAPWYVHQRLTYGGQPTFPQPATKQARGANGQPKPIYERRPLAFYVDLGLPDVITAPYRPHFLNLALPTTYAGIWGDYFGAWAWQRGKTLPTGAIVKRPSAPVRHRLVLQSLVGLLPTLLAILGWLALARSAVRSPRMQAVALLPLLGILGYLYFTVSFPTPDGDVLKASYMLTTTAGWAIGFGYALDRIRGRAWPVAFGLLSLAALVELPFLFY